jgi:hypothetical protein
MVVTGLRQDASKGVANKRTTPELQAARRRSFMANPIHCRDKDPIGYRMTPLNGLPGTILVGSPGIFLVRVPANRCRVKQDLCSLQYS